MSENTPIRVLQLIHSLHIGGAENVVVDLATNIDRQRYDVSVACINGTGVLADRLSACGVTVHGPIRAQGDGFLKTLAKLKSTIRSASPDIVHTHGDIALFDLGPVKMLSRSMPKIVHTYHFGNYPHIKKRHLYPQILYSRLVDQLVAVSGPQRETIIEHMRVRPDNIVTIRNGITPRPELSTSAAIKSKREELGVSEDDILVGCVAVLSKQKGIPFFLAAIRQIMDQHPRVKFLIVGGGPMQKELEELAVSVGVSERVKFTGWRKDAREIMPALDLFVLPSLWEAMSVVVLEAMSAGLPVILTTVGDNANVVEDGVNGRLVRPGDAAALAQAMNDLLADAALREEYGRRARQRVDSAFTVQNMVHAYEELYESVMGMNR